jgi:hypothetical protein
MHAMYYIDLMVRAVTANDTEMLGMLGARLEDCEQEKQTLRANGYGISGMPAAATALLVPPAKE